MLRLPFVAFAASALLAQDPSLLPAPTQPTQPAQILLSSPFHGVWIDDEPARDGKFWCRGDRYKMSFGTAGASYVPLLGWRAPRNFPIGFRLAGSAEVAPERRGEGFVFRHPGIEERWELRPEGAEQSFVLQERPAGDGLAIAVATDLYFAGGDAAGLHFAVEGWGEVVYGNAVAIESDGDRFDLRTTFAAGAIRIELPVGLSYPLVVDPFVSTIGVAANEAADNRNPDVAYDAGSNRWCVVMEERVSLLDTDIKVRRYTGAGALIDTVYFESSGAVADDPAVCATSLTGATSHFCVVWHQATGDIHARRMQVTSPSVGGLFALHTGGLPVSFGLRPDIAGSRVGSCLVVCILELDGIPVIKLYRINQDGSMVQQSLPIVLGCLTPHVADAMPPSNHWPITYTEQVIGCIGGDVHFTVRSQSLAVVVPPTAISAATLDDDRNADVAWNGETGMVVWDRDMGSHHDIIGRPFHFNGTSYVLGTTRNLTTLEPGINASADQQKPVIASDGCRLVVAYMEGSTPKPICATFAVNTLAGGLPISCHEGHVPIATANIDHDDMGIASMGTSGGAQTRYFVVTDERDGSNDYDVQGLFYDGRQAGTLFTTLVTGCGPTTATEPQLAVTGSSALGESFQLTMSGHSALPFLLAGLPQNPTTLLCTLLPLRQCRRGVQLPLILSSFGTTLNVTVPCEPSLVGVTLAFQGVDLTATGACGASLFGVAFAITDTIQATIR